VNSIIISLIVFVCTFAGSLCGLFLRFLLPDHHLNDDARDVVKLGAGLIATMAALVLGLLINSAKSSLDAMNNELTQSSAIIIELDENLASYGPETAEMRQLLRKSVAATLDRLSLEDVFTTRQTFKFDVSKSLRKIQSKLRLLSPQSESQTMLQSQGLEEINQLIHSRLLLREQSTRQISSIFLVILIFWLNVIFVSFGLLAPRNKTVLGVLFVCALSVSAAIFLLMEMNKPFTGYISISTSPLRSALDQLGNQ